MSEKQRVLVYGMSDNPGGIETYLRNLTKELAPEIILDFVTDFPGVAYEEELKSYGSRIYYIGAKSQGLLKQWKKFRKLLREHPEYRRYMEIFFECRGCLYFDYSMDLQKKDCDSQS